MLFSHQGNVASAVQPKKKESVPPRKGQGRGKGEQAFLICNFPFLHDKTVSSKTSTTQTYIHPPIVLNGKEGRSHRERENSLRAGTVLKVGGHLRRSSPPGIGASQRGDTRTQKTTLLNASSKKTTAFGSSSTHCSLLQVWLKG